MKKKVRLKYVGFWESFWDEKSILRDIINEHYDVELCDDPDFIVCSMFGIPYDYCEYECVRVFYSGENYTPDFNLVDYAIGQDDMTFLDRYYRYPQCFTFYEENPDVEHRHLHIPNDILSTKPYFCNFIAGHESEYGIRGDFFKKLSQYKRIESAGSYLNNMPNNERVSLLNNDKRSLQKKCKFTLCFESTAQPGFCTEKLLDAFCADTIPIYYGDENADQIFNGKAYIDCSKFASFDDACKEIIRLDNDDAAYMEMLRQPVFNDENILKEKYQGLVDFVCHIFDQEPLEAYRRSRVYLPRYYNDYLREYAILESYKETARIHSFIKQWHLLIKKLFQKY